MISGRYKGEQGTIDSPVTHHRPRLAALFGVSSMTTLAACQTCLSWGVFSENSLFAAVFKWILGPNSTDLVHA
jgi:hypothetical protein